MRYIISFIIIFIVLGNSQAQYKYSITYGFDKISIGNHSVKWTTDGARSLKFNGSYRLKHFDLGIMAMVGKYNLYRPSYKYEQEYSMFGATISKSFFQKNNFSLNIALTPFVRTFDTEFYSASLIIDSYNYGIRFDADICYKISGKVGISIGYSFDNDLYRTAINSNEITSKDRFINMMVNSLKIGVTFGTYEHKHQNEELSQIK